MVKQRLLQNAYRADWRPPLALRLPAHLFRRLVALRRQAYARGLLPVYRAPLPVIVVGNITVGGTGKTPLVIWLTQTLRGAGLRPGVVSRGYGGQARQWPQAVEAHSDPALVGDEPVLIARRTTCPVMVAPDRCAAIRALLARHDVDVIISDDGLQHYAMARDLEIAVIDGQRRLGNGWCLPAGPLREPATRLASVDWVVNNGGPAKPGEYLMRLEMTQAVNLRSGQRRPLADFGPVHAVAGIGHPQRFFAQLRQQGLRLTPHPFADHHRYTAQELAFDGEVLMTEKDAVKCRHFAHEGLWYVPVQARLEPEFKTALLARLDALRNTRKT